MACIISLPCTKIIVTLMMLYQETNFTNSLKFTNSCKVHSPFNAAVFPIIKSRRKTKIHSNRHRNHDNGIFHLSTSHHSKSSQTYQFADPQPHRNEASIVAPVDHVGFARVNQATCTHYRNRHTRFRVELEWSVFCRGEREGERDRAMGRGG